MLLTDKQLEMLLVISKKNTDGSLVDKNQLVAAQSYGTTKAAMQFIIRTMTKRGLIRKAGVELREERLRTVFEITEVGQSYLKPHFRTLKDDLIETEHSSFETLA